MILIEGPRADISKAMIEGLLGAMPMYEMQHIAHANKSPSLRKLLSVIQSDHRYQIHTGLVALGYSDGTLSMLRYGLSMAGSVVVVCGGTPAVNNFLPTVCVNDVNNVPERIAEVVEKWERARTYMLSLWEYHSLYSIGPDRIMLVADRHTKPVGMGFAMPFFGQQEPCIFLHDAMVRAGGNYYLTSAIKFKRDKANMDAIAHEIRLIKPSRIVALGSDAAAMVARLGSNFVTTYHPQYWHRFKSGNIDELVDILRPHFFTNQNQ